MNEAQFDSLSEQVQTSLEMSRQTQVMMVQFIEHIFPSMKLEIKADLAEQIVRLRTELKQDVVELKQDVVDLRTELTGGFIDVRARLDGLSADVSEIRRRLDYQIAKIARVEEQVDFLKAQ